jgi:hypothetical protein
MPDVMSRNGIVFLFHATNVVVESSGTSWFDTVDVDVIEKTPVQPVPNEENPINADSLNQPLHSRISIFPTNHRKSRSAKPGSRDFLQQRIHRLESLVTDLAAQVRNSNASPESSQSPEQRTNDTSDVSSHTSPNTTTDDKETDSHEPIEDIQITLGEMKISDGKVTYTSGNSWNTILNEIADIKMALNPLYSSWGQYMKDTNNLTPLRPTSFPFFAVAATPISDLLALLPSREDIEILVDKYVSRMSIMCPCLHVPTFYRSLNAFFIAPDSVDPIFLGTLFACLACGISISEEDGPVRNILVQKGVATKKEMAFIWRDASMQAFCLGSFLSNTSLENLQVFP